MKTISGLKAFTLPGGLAALILLSGCFETKQEFTLNPDGSGKVVHESTFQTMDITGGGQRDAERQMKAAVAEVISQSKGVEAWRDVSYEIGDDGRIAFRGTAYFRNLSELDIPNQTMLEFDWARDGGTGNLSEARWRFLPIGLIQLLGIDYNLNVDGGNALVSTVNITGSATIRTLTISSGDTVSINNGATLELEAFSGTGTLANAGTSAASRANTSVAVAADQLGSNRRSTAASVSTPLRA